MNIGFYISSTSCGGRELHTQLSPAIFGEQNGGAVDVAMEQVFGR
jgi:hypothetical protein